MKRSGFALATALGGIIVIGVLIGGVFFMSTQEVRVASGALVQERAFRAAELGLNSFMSTWDNSTMAAKSQGSVTVQVYSGTGWVDTVRATKLTGTTYTLVSTAVAGTGIAAARKTTGMSVRIGLIDFDMLGALTVRGSTKIGGSSYITGFDSNPTTWTDCPIADDSMPGIAIGNLSDLQLSGCPGNNCVDGNPEILQSAAANDTSTYFKFGDFDWASLTAAATKVYNGGPTMTGIGPSVDANGVCLTGLTNNWGSPYHTIPANSCENYWPIIHIKGSGVTTTISGGRGQGILLVDGNLDVTGSFEFYGPVIVRGTLKTTGTGGKLNGGVMAANVALEQNTVLGDATIKFSNCVIMKAQQAGASPRRLAHRAWVDMY